MSLEIILQLIYSAMAITGCGFVVCKKRFGWLLWAIATPFIVGALMLSKSYILIPPFIVYLGLDIWGWIKWRD